MIEQWGYQIGISNKDSYDFEIIPLHNSRIALAQVYRQSATNEGISVYSFTENKLQIKTESTNRSFYWNVKGY